MPSKRLNSSTRRIDGTLKGTTTPGQGEPEYNADKKLLYIPQIQNSLSDVV